MVLRSPAEFATKGSRKATAAAAKLVQYARLWDVAAAVMLDTDVAFAGKYTACAFTHNFSGSPHIDTLDIGPQYAMGLGDYQGGELCVESSAREVTQIDTRGRLAKMDGRYPHWVDPFEGERFSLIYYQTKGEASPRGPAVPAMDSQPPSVPTAVATMGGTVYSFETLLTSTVAVEQA
jgi:hypothetical protein